ncbi:MAG: hypothetical protein Q8N99_02715 [Nanoarchaeota archaeon]|nr:hypothetical protein [Nanoarchaeota archaeon]
MKKQNLSREEIQEKIKDVFSNFPNEKEIKNIKKLAMSKNIKLGDYKKKFCKKCCSFFNAVNSEIRIKKGFRVIQCKECGYRNRYKLKE